MAGGSVGVAATSSPVVGPSETVTAAPPAGLGLKIRGAASRWDAVGHGVGAGAR